MIPRYLYPKEDELLPIPYYFTKLELGIEDSKKGGKTRRVRKTKKKSKLRRKVKTHRKTVR